LVELAVGIIRPHGEFTGGDPFHAEWSRAEKGGIIGIFFCEVDGEVQPGKRISGISKLI
jgi:hypothetical protein